MSKTEREKQANTLTVNANTQPAFLFRHWQSVFVFAVLFKPVLRCFNARWIKQHWRFISLASASFAWVAVTRPKAKVSIIERAAQETLKPIVREVARMFLVSQLNHSNAQSYLHCATFAMNFLFDFFIHVSEQYGKGLLKRDVFFNIFSPLSAGYLSRYLIEIARDENPGAFLKKHYPFIFLLLSVFCILRQLEQASQQASQQALKNQLQAETVKPILRQPYAYKKVFCYAFSEKTLKDLIQISLFPVKTQSAKHLKKAGVDFMVSVWLSLATDKFDVNGVLTRSIIPKYNGGWAALLFNRGVLSPKRQPAPCGVLSH